MAAVHEGRIRLHVGDLTRLEVDAIVNAANQRLARGGGVCGAIHRAAGPELARECAQIGFCPTGEARITGGYGLPARHVIHTVGPVWRGGERDEDRMLASCYRAALDVAADRGLRSVAFPAISTGVYGFPLDRATEIAVRATREWLARGGEMDEIVFAVVGPEAEAAYRRELAGV